MIGWTTAPSKEKASQLAEGLIESKLAACVQIAGPITSVYTWKGETESTQEYRLTLKFLPVKAEAIKNWVKANHPYEIPQWLAVTACETLPEYYQWARDCCSREEAHVKVL